ncbi:MAG TPA: hypothetical protein PKE38_07755 [Ignavibacteriaceae bacterium]|nr:hypothetical protein [Ignavibacteriaceae bacterium]
MKMKPCKTCGHMIAKSASVCPNCGQKYSRIGGCFAYFIIFIVVAIMISYMINSLSKKNPEESKIQTPKDDLTLFISKYGEPDQIKSSENEIPRPPILTKQLIYKKENVRAVYVPDAPVGSSPPYDKWKLLGFQDNRTNKVLQPEEVVRRLEKRQKK